MGRMEKVWGFFDKLERRGFWGAVQIVLCIGCIIAAAILISNEKKDNGKTGNEIHQVSKDQVRQV
jgi:hypothetical protein